METNALNHFLAGLARSSVEAGILVVLVLAAQRLFHRQLTPQWGCFLWMLVAVRLILPLSLSSGFSVFNLMPAWTPPESARPMATTSLPVSVATEHPPLLAPPEGTETFVDQRLAPSKMPPTSGYHTHPATSSAAPKTRSWATGIFAAWLAGVLLLVGQVAVSSLRLRRRSARWQPLREPGALAALQDCCARLQLPHPPALLESREVGSPALHGLFRPQLLLPKGFTTKFSPLELRFVLLHELAHLKRRDLLMNWIAALLQAGHWFNPLVRLGFARWRAERELACDAMALEAAGEGLNKEYGRTILRLLDNCAQPLATPGLVGILEDKSHLKRRIGMIANFVPNRRWPGLALALLAVLAVIGLTDARTGATSSAQTAVNPPAAVAAALPAAAPDAGEQPLSKITNNSNTETDNKMKTTSLTIQLARAATIGLLALAAPTTTTTVHAGGIPAAPMTSALAEELKGAWILVGKPGHVGEPPSDGGRIKIFTGSHWCMTQAHTKNGVVLFHHGGTYTLEGNTYHERVEFANPSTMSAIGGTNGNFTITIEGDTMTDIGIDNPWKEVWKRVRPSQSGAAESRAGELAGTWILVGKPGEENATPRAGGQLKFITDGRWCDTQFDPTNGVVFEHHGGSYSFKGDEYTESCEYGNPTSMDMIGQDAKFGIKLNGDTLTLIGINNRWNQVWKRLY
jgi:beta-lactamase regulating signal transducer with metallopeptidase domain